MKSIVFILFISFSYICHSQYILKGTVSDMHNSGIPGVRITVKNTTYGVITNMKGEYFLELKNKGNIDVVYSMIGYKDSTQSITISQKYTTHNILLKENIEQLGVIEISVEKESVSKRVIKQVNKHKKEHRLSTKQYSCNTYIKTSLEKELKPLFAEKAKADTIIVLGKSKMNFIESYSITKFKSPNKYHEEILAHHDYADKSGKSASASVNLDFGDDILPNQDIEHNAYIFYEKVEDGNFDIYQNLITLPKISDKPILSPIADGAGISYKYLLTNIFFENNQKIYDIEVTPRNSQAPLFSGHLYIIDSLWIIKSFDLAINPACMPLFKDFRIIQDYTNINNNWVVNRREFNYSMSDFQQIVSANTRVNHSNYNFNPNFTKKTFNNEVLSYNINAFNKDSSEWNQLRPIQLKSTELDFIHQQDSITNYLESEHYLDSIDREYNKVTFWDVTLSGIGFRNRFKKQDIYINSLLQSAKLFGVGGFRYGFGGEYVKEFKNAHKINIDGELDYGFNNKDVKGDIGLEYTYLPLKFGSFKIRAGDIYDMVNNYESVVGTFSRSNYVRKQFLGFSQRLEIFNGFYAKLGFDFSTRQEITNLKLSDWSNNLFGELNEPQPFEQYTVSILELNLVYKFKQKYVIKQNKKQLIGSKYPTLKLTYKKGIPTLFGSDVNFDFLELSASDKMTLGTFGDLKWNFIAGSFINKVDLKFIEHKFFRGSDSFLFSNPLKSHQLLDSTFHTPDPYFQAFAIHHFKGAIMNKIPLINKLKLELVAGASALLIQDINYSHIEFFGGIERPFKIRRQVLKIGVYTALRDNNVSTGALRFKIGLDFFNSYTNSWSY